MELSKPGSHAWEAERGDKRTIISLIPTHSHTLCGVPSPRWRSERPFHLSACWRLYSPPRGAIARSLRISTRSAIVLLFQLTEDGERTADGTNGVGIERYEFLSGQILTARGLIDFAELCHECGDNRLFDIHKVQNELSNRYRTVVFRKR